jgi:N-acetylglucosaminyldiphosphoundecaprenol N-acetyl-beta-D-mannosaminyltransferase
MPIAPISAAELLERVESSLAAGRGGWIVTANLDILGHFLSNTAARQAYLEADLRIADGMPLVWAALLQGEALPGRIAGSSLCEPLLALCSQNGWPVALIGGKAGTAERAAERLLQHFPSLDVHADSTLRFNIPPAPDQIAQAEQAIGAGRAKLVLVGLGSPKQEYVIQQLRKSAPASWFIGVGGSFSFMAGDVKRAPGLLQQSGFEWAHRLASEPRRLAKRYLLHNLPLAIRVLARAAAVRATRARSKAT